jgi:hypothetical protein
MEMSMAETSIPGGEGGGTSAMHAEIGRAERILREEDDEIWDEITMF